MRVMTALDQLVADRLLVGLGQDVGGRPAGLGGGNPLDDRRRVLVAGVQPLEVDEGDPAEPAESDREVGICDGVHGRGQERDLESEAAEIGGEIDLGRVRGDGARDECDLVETVGASEARLGGVANRCLLDHRAAPG